jgi:1-acyl-sn-glycerol-3-phosphate acyltransferase
MACLDPGARAFQLFHAAGNHASELDPIVVRAALALSSRFAPLFYVSASKEFYDDKDDWRAFLYGGLFFKCWGAWPVYFGTQDYKQAFKHHIRILEEGHAVCIFPEGKVTKDGKMGRARSGVALLGYHTKAPIIPVSISGTHHLTPGRFLSRKRKVYVNFGKPIMPYELGIRVGSEPSHEQFRLAAEGVLERIGESLVY